MEFQKILENRKSVRAYKPDALPEGAVEKLAYSVTLAPTACNKQPFKIYFVTNPELKNKICGVIPWGWPAQAPAIAVMTGNYQECWQRREGDPAADIDCAIVMEHFVLQATELGLGTCWICAFERAEMDKVLGISAPWRTVAVCPVGFPAEEPPRRPRKELDRIFQVIS